MAIATSASTVSSSFQQLGKKVMEHGTFTVAATATEQWAVLKYLKYIDTITIQIGKINAQPAVLLVVKPNIGCEGAPLAEVARLGNVYFKGSATFTAADVLEFVAFGDTS
jgi:hypothetical protein